MSSANPSGIYIIPNSYFCAHPNLSAYSSMARAPETWLDPQGPGHVYVELIDLEASEDATTGPRVQVPAPGRQCVKWLKSGEKCDALVEIAEPGLVRVFPWEPYGTKILNRIKEL